MSLTTRLAKLEQALAADAGTTARRCPHCGADWPGNVYLSVGGPDGPAGRPRCIRCDAEREHPGGPLLGITAGLMAAI